MTAKTYLTIDIGGTHIKYAVINTDQNIIEQGKKTTPRKEGLDAFWQVMFEIVDDYQERVSGIAISVPGKVDTVTGTVYFGGALPFLDGACFKQILGDKYGLPVALQNDAKAAAQAELWLGSLKGISDGAVLTLGTGVGGGIVTDGKLRLGPHFQAGELSMSILDASQDSFQKSTGFLGSAVRMVSQVNEAVGNSDKGDGLPAFAAIEAKEPKALAIFETYCRNIAYLILTIQALYDLTTYVIGGGISTQPLLVEEINRQFRLYVDSNPIMAMNVPSVDIIAATLGNDANLYGALYNLLLQEGELS